MYKIFCEHIKKTRSTLLLFMLAICMELLAKECSKKEAMVYTCELCDYISCKKFNYEKHLSTIKHKVTVGDICHLSGDAKVYTCKVCSATYGSRNGLWKHSKLCVLTPPQPIRLDEHLSDKDLIVMLMKQNTELMDLLKTSVPAAGQITNSLNTTTNTNSHNKTFNLQFFLNETCKDAMNIMDFVDSIKLQLSDLERVGELGYSQGISNIITANLKSLDVTQRPVHCTDRKRETMYIKDDNKWEKEDDAKTTLRKVIKRIANKNIRLLPQFREKYPEYGNSYAKISDKYNKIALEAMGGAGNNDIEKEDKILHNISKTTTIEKYMNI